MFIFRIIKKLIFFGLFVLLVLWGATYKVDGKTLYQVGKDFIASENFSQSVKDLKMFFGGFLKSVGEQIQEDVSEKDKQQLEKVIQDQLKQGAKK